MSFTPPPYPYERLDVVKDLANAWEGGAIDCSIGTPVDAPPEFVLAELARASGARGYPPSAGTLAFREAAATWLQRRLHVELDPGNVAACVGTKEFVGTVAGYLHLRQPERDTVLYPEISYPTYAMGATLAGLRSVPVRVENGRLDLASISAEDVARTLVLWTNSPSNPTGDLDDLDAAATWGRERGVLVASDECYSEFTWSSAPRTILEHGSQGVLALHSISKRSNLAGLRAGFYAGDPATVEFLRSVRQHAGFMVPAPVQAAVALAYGDDGHVEVQRERYRRRLEVLSGALVDFGVESSMPQGTFYLWCQRLGLNGWELAEMIAKASGLVVSPGELYGERGRDHVRVALVQPDERVELAAQRLRASTPL
ncbi:MAG TPA: aminotransferase class I/II-fold pyridoxal phosphate-dependent enzyme [Acidimicrobiales bacterium]|nr:aminotransferase class I/II-fold pyridoxal phosphate-dependent enzyme [Acidimicrobiales bacterium]